MRILVAAAVAVALCTSPLAAVAQYSAPAASPQALPKLKAKILRGEVLEAQNLLNRELFGKLARGSSAANGLWMSGTDPAAPLVIRTVMQGDNVLSNLVTGLTADGLQHGPSEFMFDESTGTVARYEDGVPRAWLRVARVQDGSYAVISMPTSLLSESEASRYRTFYKFSGDILVRAQDGKSTLHRWMTLDEGRKQLADARRERSLAAQYAASGSTPTQEQRTLWKSRWGRLADVAATSNFYYNPVTGDISPVLSEFEWVVPGWKMIVSWVQPGQPKQKMTEYTWDPIARRIHLSSLLAGQRFEGHAVAAADGTVEIDMGSSRTHWRAGPGGFAELATDFIDPTMTDSSTYLVQDNPRNRESAAAMSSARREQVALERARAEEDRRQAADAKRAQSQRSAALFNSVLQGVSQGLAEADTGGYAEAQANLDATVANIQDAAAAERQQQLYAEQQKSQARASQDRQDRYDESQVLATNAEAAAEGARQAGGNPTNSNGGIDAQPRPIATAARQAESSCSEAPGFRKIFGYAEKTRELAMRSMMETPHLEPLQDVSCTQPPNLGYTLEGWWKCTAMAPTGLMVKHCPQSNSGVSTQ